MKDFSMTIALTIALSIILGYFLGSIPFGLVLTKLAGTEDIRKIGSGSIGATNVLRTGRKDLAILTVLLDAFKAAIAYIIICNLLSSETLGFFAGIAAIVGHNFPIWLKFKGGKGVASTFGFALIASPVVGLLTCLTWLATAIIYRYSSLSALVASIMMPIYAYIIAPQYYPYYIFLTVLLFVRHHSNIKRLLKGEESKINLKKK